jgi:hypothetical protein
LIQDDLKDREEEKIAAVGIDFNDVFSGVRVRGLHIGEEHFVDHAPGGGIE